MRVKLDFANKRAKVRVDGKDLGMFRDSVEVDGTSISLEEWEYHSNKRVGAEEPLAQAHGGSTVGSGGGGRSNRQPTIQVDMDRKAEARNDVAASPPAEKTFVVTKGEEK